MPPLCGKVLGGHACSTHMLCDLWVHVRVHVMCIQQEYTCVSMPCTCVYCVHACVWCVWCMCTCACVWCTCMRDPQTMEHHQPSGRPPPVHVSVGAGTPSVCTCVRVHAHVWYTCMHDPQPMGHQPNPTGAPPRAMHAVCMRRTQTGIPEAPPRGTPQ